MLQKPKIIISGGGTGGHIFPAIAIANEIKAHHPNAELLFVGANGKMEMTKVPQHGYKIIGLDIVGIQRKLTLRNLLVPFKVVASLLKARKIIKEFNPQLAIGVGGYASGPLLKMASWMGLPYIIQEQNSYAGVTNKILAKKASKICVAYKDMEHFFPKDKIILTGNPIRAALLKEIPKEQALSFFNLDPYKRTILIIGGSLGAKTINESIGNAFEELISKDLQLIWQTGAFYFKELEAQFEGKRNLFIQPFIEQMDYAYSAADLVISRAGALSVSEISAMGKPVIFVPSPNVAEDHQTKNAAALVKERAALMVKDAEARKTLGEVILKSIFDENLLGALSANIKALAKPNASKEIYNVIADTLVNEHQ